MQLTLREAASLLQVTEKEVLRWIKKDNLPACKVSESYRINRVDLLEWATERRIKLSPEIFAQLEVPDRTLPKISAALAEGGIHYNVPGDDPQTVLKNIVDKIKGPPQMDREFLLQVLLAREALGTTAIGNGIAIPHVRNPILLHDISPSITLSFLAKPADFQALDGKPVNIIFTLITPTVRTHLHVLSRLAYLLRDERLQTVLRQPGSPEEIIHTIRSIEAELKI